MPARAFRLNGAKASGSRRSPIRTSAQGLDVVRSRAAGRHGPIGSASCIGGVSAADHQALAGHRLQHRPGEHERVGVVDVGPGHRQGGHRHLARDDAVKWTRLGSSRSSISFRKCCFQVVPGGACRPQTLGSSAPISGPRRPGPRPAPWAGRAGGCGSREGLEAAADIGDHRHVAVEQLAVAHAQPGVGLDLGFLGVDALVDDVGALAQGRGQQER